MNEIVENKTDNAQVKPTPAPEAQAPVKVNEDVSPATSHAENAKHNAAFAAMRKRAREAERKLAANQYTTPPQAANAEVPAVTEVRPEVATAPVAVKTEVDIEAESEKALISLGSDAELAGILGSVIDIATMVDNDPQYKRLHDVSPALAYREAKAAYLSKAGISTPPPVPKTAPSATGVKGASEDLAVLFAEIDNCQPGTKRFNEVKKKIDAIRRKG